MIGLSLPDMIILKKVVKLALILIFVGVVASGIMGVGYLFNVIYSCGKNPGAKDFQGVPLLR